MQVLHTRCAGLDVHKDTVMACVRCVSPPTHQEVRSFDTTTAELLKLADWLGEHDGPSSGRSQGASACRAGAGGEQGGQRERGEAARKACTRAGDHRVIGSSGRGGRVHPILCRTFKRAFSVPPHRYLLTRRMSSKVRIRHVARWRLK